MAMNRFEEVKRSKICYCCYRTINKGELHLGFYSGKGNKNARASMCMKCIVKSHLLIGAKSEGGLKKRLDDGRLVHTATRAERTRRKRKCHSCGRIIKAGEYCVRLDSGTRGSAMGNACSNCITTYNEEVCTDELVEEIFQDEL